MDKDYQPKPRWIQFGFKGKWWKCSNKEIYVIFKSCARNEDSKTGRIIGISVFKCVIWRKSQDNGDIKKYLQVHID